MRYLAGDPTFKVGICNLIISIFNQKVGVICILSLLFISSAYAGWTDDWITQHTETSPGHFEGQKRGYWTAGSFSGRWQGGNDYVWTIMPPKLKTGCGGIDLFMGGFSFLDTQYLVNKLQAILSAAPAAAFDIALKTLCEQCASTIKTLENTTNMLNGLQLNDCKASRALVATIAKPFFDGQTEKELKEIQDDFLQSSGIYDLYTQIRKDTEANKDKPITDTKQAISGCPQNIKDVFGTGGSLIQNMGNKIGFTNTAYLDLIRGLIGDVIITPLSNAYKMKYVAPCAQNENFSIRDFLNGTVKARNISLTCYPITDANRDLVLWVQNRMNQIVSRMKNRVSLTSSDQAFIDASPIPIEKTIKMAIGTKQESAILTTLSDVMAKAYAYRIMLDLYNRAYHLLETAKEMVSAQSSAVGNNENYKCRLELVDDAMNQIPEMQATLMELMKEIRASYAQSAEEVDTVLNLVQRMSDYDEQSRGNLSEHFGKTVFFRVKEKSE